MKANVILRKWLVISKTMWKCFIELLNGVNVLKIMQSSVLMQVLSNIFINELASAVENASLMYNTTLKGECNHLEGHD